jgi:pilus assembly protein CpaE
MPDDVGARTAAPSGQASEASSARAGRAAVLAFISDPESEAVLRQGLEKVAQEGMDVIRGNGRAAVAALRKMPSPRVLIVDITGEEQPLSLLGALSEVVEPDIRVLVVGDRQDMTLYRQLTRGLGVAEYLFKPLSAEVVAQHFGQYIGGSAAVTAQPTGGRVITITGSCGGSGATTLAANLAWHLAADASRHTVLLDPNLYTGTAAMLLSARTGAGLRTALETPQRVDELFLERIAQPAADRLAVIAGEEKLTDPTSFAPGGAERLLQVLRQRYNYIIVDLPFTSQLVTRELMEQARQRILVTEPTLPALRDAIRLLALPMGSQQSRRPVLVLNKVGAPGTMGVNEAEDALQQKIDVCIPFLPRQVNAAAMMGKPAVASLGGFRDALHQLGREVTAFSADIPAAKRSFSFSKLLRLGDKT